MDKQYFNDSSIVEQSIALIQTGAKLTNGISLVIRCGNAETEIVLEREQLEDLLKDLREDWEIHQGIMQVES